MIDEYMDKLPVIPGGDIGTGNQEPVQPFVETGVDRRIVSYVPVTELVIDDAHSFFEAWASHGLHS